MTTLKLYDDDLPENAVVELLSIFEGHKVSVAQAQKIASRIAPHCTRTTIVHLMRHLRGSVRFIGVEALRLGPLELDNELGDVLLSAIDDHTGVAVAAIKTFGRKQYTQAVAEIAACLTMQNPRIVAAAMQTMVVLDKMLIRTEYVLTALTSTNTELFNVASRTAFTLQLVEAAPLMLNWLQTYTSISDPLEDKNKLLFKTCKSVIKILGLFGYVEAIPVLQHIATHSYGLRTVALKSLAQLGVDINNLAHDAYQANPSQSLGALLGQLATAEGRLIDPKHADVPAKPAKAPVQFAARTNPVFEENTRILQTLGANFGVGSISTGEIKIVTAYHALIELRNGITGKVGLKELNWRRNPNLAHYLEIGQIVNVMVIGIEESGRVELSMRQLMPNPWASIAANVMPEQIVVGTIESITVFGLFVWFESYQVTGLVHESEIPDELVEKFTEHYQIGQELQVKVLKINVEQQRFGLTLRIEADNSAKLDGGGTR